MARLELDSFYNEPAYFIINQLVLYRARSSWLASCSRAKLTSLGSSVQSNYIIVDLSSCVNCGIVDQLVDKLCSLVLKLLVFCVCCSLAFIISLYCVFIIWLASQTSWLELFNEPSRASLLARWYNEPSRAEPVY